MLIKDQFPEVYVPTVFENYVADIEVDGKQIPHETKEITQKTQLPHNLYLKNCSDPKYNFNKLANMQRND
ncbi:Ras-like GTP-binding protein O-RHO [Pseudolycoriella hygida]|uniref:Ras-like GTP-binding protein O-RHO n=1 Tax=Pseudolycoriella hygida TaxID=35572 RepID=A0A9Q0RUT8_9DIPT|nr:Ras-like GTP-binding protein O-RHO [Pseudolycoriella hygida]